MYTGPEGPPWSLAAMPKTPPHTGNALPLAAVDLQILLVLAEGELYGYAIKKAVERESDGVLSPEIGSLYRVLARLMDSGWVEEVPSPRINPEPQRGRPRRYYSVTPAGLEVARAEVQRLRLIVEGSGRIALEGAP